MKFKINKNDLSQGLQAVQSVITSKTALPILSHILLQAEQNTLKLTATDLDIGLTYTLSLNTLESGAITLPAKRFNDIIRDLSNDEITITTKKNNLVIIETPACEFKLMGLPAEEFPKLPEFKDKEVVNLEQGELKKMLTLTSFAVSLDETRYILNGILFKMHNYTITTVATDGRRLAIMEQKCPASIEKEIQIIIPIKAIQELSRNLEEEGTCSVVVGDNQILFELPRVTLISRLIEGDFPDYQQVVTAPAANKIKIEREKFFWAIKRAALLTTPDYQAIKLEVFKNKLVISKSTPDIGESREELDTEYGGKELIIGFNPHYLIDVLKNLDDATIEFEVTESEKPGVIRRNGYTYIVLPMRLG